MKKYILIMVITLSPYEGGLASFSAEFDSIDSCNFSLREIAKDVKKSSYGSVLSAGCHEK